MPPGKGAWQPERPLHGWVSGELCHGRGPWWKGMGNPRKACPQERGHGSLKGRSMVGFPESPMSRTGPVTERDGKPEESMPPGKGAWQPERPLHGWVSGESYVTDGPVAERDGKPEE